MNEPFGHLADEFIERIRASKITATTEVFLVYQCVDQAGNPLPPFRDPITPKTTVRFPGDPEGAKALATTMHIQTIIDNINSLVRSADPDELVMLRGAPQIPMRIVGFELEVQDVE